MHIYNPQGRNSRSYNNNYKGNNHNRPPHERKQQPRFEPLRFDAQIRLSGSAVGFADHPTQKGVSVRIHSEDLNGAFNKDTVVIETIGKKFKDDELGKVVKIVERFKKQYVGELDTAVKGEFAYILPDDKKMYKDIKVLNPEKGLHGNKVVVKINSWPHGASPQGEIIKDLGSKGTHETEIQSALYEQGFDSHFPAGIEEEAQKIKDRSPEDFKREETNRRDYRGNFTCTIDPADAKDFDDALSIFPKDNGKFEVGIHIADVSHFVTPGTDIDKEAFERSFSVYMVDRTVPMLPEVLSNNLCSLMPEEDRLAFSAIFEMDMEGNVSDRWFGKTIIKSDKRFAYEDAQAVLNGEKESPYKEQLEQLRTISKELEKEKRAAGAISFDSDEFKFELDDNGVPIRVYKKERLDTHHLVEEFMLLANREVAQHMSEWDEKQKGKEKGLMYRVHGEPDHDRLASLQEFLKIMKYDLKLNEDGGINPKELNRIIAQAKGTPEEELINTTAVRTMQKAIYSILDDGHFGLAFDSYTHFTSPIRRYPDLLVHRIMQAIVTNEGISDDKVEYFKKAATHASDQEVAASEAERNSIKFKQAEFMSAHVGEEFDGVISGVTDWGLYVKLSETGAEGMIRADSLKGDFFLYEEKRYRYIGEKTKKIYMLGDVVHIKVASVNIEERNIDFEVAKEK